MYIKLIWWTFRTYFCALITTFLLFCRRRFIRFIISRFIPLLSMLYLGCGNYWHCSIYSFFVLGSVDTNNTNIVARSEPFIFIFYLYWNFIYVRWTGSSHSLDTLVFIVWFTQLIHVCRSPFQYWWWTKHWPPVHGLPKWTTLKWTTPKNTVSDEY